MYFFCRDNERLKDHKSQLAQYSMFIVITELDEKILALVSTILCQLSYMLTMHANAGTVNCDWVDTPHGISYMFLTAILWNHLYPTEK